VAVHGRDAGMGKFRDRIAKRDAAGRPPVAPRAAGLVVVACTPSIRATPAVSWSGPPTLSSATSRSPVENLGHDAGPVLRSACLLASRAGGRLRCAPRSIPAPPADRSRNDPVWGRLADPYSNVPSVCGGPRRVARVHVPHSANGYRLITRARHAGAWSRSWPHSPPSGADRSRYPDRPVPEGYPARWCRKSRAYPTMPPPWRPSTTHRATLPSRSRSARAARAAQLFLLSKSEVTTSCAALARIWSAWPSNCDHRRPELRQGVRCKGLRREGVRMHDAAPDLCTLSG